MKNAWTCSHCRKKIRGASTYIAHVKECLSLERATWDEGEYAQRYYRQVRAISRYRDSTPKQRSPFRSWAWWAVPKQGGVPL